MGISLDSTQITVIENVARITLIAFAVILIVYLWNATYSSAVAKDAVARMVGGDIAAIFWVGVIVLGVIIPIGVSIGTYFAGEASSALLLTAVVTEIIGGLALRYVILKGGIYIPLTSGE
jgi:formate-dependent nitrite reductase membrane component NrfD